MSGHLHQYCCFSPMFHHNWHEWGQEWVTRGHQSEAGGWSLDSLTQYSRWRAPVLLAVGVHSAISGLSPVSALLTSLSARAAWSRPELQPLCPRPGPAAAGQSERRGQWLVSPGLGRERECSHQALVTIRHQNRVTGAHYTALSSHTVTHRHTIIEVCGSISVQEETFM